MINIEVGESVGIHFNIHYASVIIHNNNNPHDQQCLTEYIT
jgi:hypothetical protein